MVAVEQLSAFRNGVDDILASLGKFLGDLVEAPTREVGEAQTLMDAQLQHFWKVYYALKKRHDDASLSAAILALTKSGKSTLLNAIMGRECLPMNNVPETARLCKIEHKHVPQPLMLERGLEFRGDVEIRRRLQEINSEVRAREYQPADENMLHILTPISVFDDQLDSGTKFFLLDTPGPNEAGEEGLRFQVERLLDTVDAVIYLLDYTKLKTAEEAAIFTRLKQINPLLVRRLSQRLFFVVNKSDQLHESEGLDEQDTKEYVAQLVTQQLAVEGFHLTPEQVILLSARNALSARLVLAGQPPSERFLRQAFGARWQRLQSKLSQADLCSAARGLLEESGIQELEERVLGFLYNHSGSLKTLAVIDDVARLLQEVWNVTESCRAALAKNVEELQRQAEAMRGQLQGTMLEFESTMKHAEALQADVTDEIRQHLDNLRTKLFNYIMQTLEPEIQGAATPIAGRSQPSRWKSIRDKFLGLFGGAGRSASRSKDELASLLIELHEDLLAQISSEVSEFWHVLENCTSLRHTLLISTINKELKTLSGRVEHIVSEALDVELEAVQISLQMPTAEQFHSDLQDLITRGIAEKTERHIRVGQRKYEERVMRFRQGLCRLGTYWENVPRTRTVVETYNVTVFQVQPSEILNHFIHMVDSAVDNTSSVLHAYVRTFMQHQLDQARDKIQAYADRYMKAMSAALESSCAGEASRQRALSQVATRLRQVDELRAAVSEMQAKVEAVVPQHDYEEVDYDLYELLLEQQREQQRREAAAVQAEAADVAGAAEALPIITPGSSSSAVASSSSSTPLTVYEALLMEAGIVPSSSSGGDSLSEPLPGQEAEKLAGNVAVDATETSSDHRLEREAAPEEHDFEYVQSMENSEKNLVLEQLEIPKLAGNTRSEAVVGQVDKSSLEQEEDSAGVQQDESAPVQVEESVMVRNDDSAPAQNESGPAAEAAPANKEQVIAQDVLNPRKDLIVQEAAVKPAVLTAREVLMTAMQAPLPDDVQEDMALQASGVSSQAAGSALDADSAQAQAVSGSEEEVGFDDVDSMVLVSAHEGKLSENGAADSSAAEFVEGQQSGQTSPESQLSGQSISEESGQAATATQEVEAEKVSQLDAPVVDTDLEGAPALVAEGNNADVDAGVDDEEDLLFADYPHENAATQLPPKDAKPAAGQDLIQTAEEEDARSLAFEYNSVDSKSGSETGEDDIPTLMSEDSGEPVHAEGKLDDQVSLPPSPASYQPLVEVAADYASFSPVSPFLPGPPAGNLPPVPTPSSQPSSNGLPVVDAAAVASEPSLPQSHSGSLSQDSSLSHYQSPIAMNSTLAVGEGILTESKQPLTQGELTTSQAQAEQTRGIEEQAHGNVGRTDDEETEYDSVHRDDVPFDYQRGFFAAMSTSQMAQEQEGESTAKSGFGSEDEWEVVEGEEQAKV